MPRPPNILFILTDQLSARALGAAGHPDIATPNIDRIARRGVRFTNAHCAAPVCTPSRTTLLTGRMPHEVGVNTNDDPFDPALVRLGHDFRAAGYETAHAGRWYLTHPDPVGNAQGFEFLPFATTPRTDYLGADTDPLTADAAISFLRRPHPQPFLLWVSLFNPHDICHVVGHNEVVPRREAEGPGLPLNFPRDPFEPEFIQDCRRRSYYGNEQNQTRDWTLDHWRGYLHAYHRLVEAVDVQVGRVLDALEAQGLADDTLIVFTSDHGEGMAAHHWVVKLMLYQEVVNVPLIFAGAGINTPGQTDDQHLASGVDVLPTLCDFAGVQSTSPCSGQSLRPVLNDPSLPGRPFVVSELQPDTRDATRMGRMLRTPRFKYIAFSHGRDPEMLFDLQTDPGETRNLAPLPAHDSTRLELRALLQGWIEQTADRFVLPAGDTVSASPTP